MPLTPKQERFVAEYLIDLNATQAAIRAGYSAKTASQGAAQLLANIKVQAAVAEGRAKLAEKTELTQQMVIVGLLKEANREGDNTTHGARVSAWGWLGKTMGMFVDRSEVDLRGSIADRLARARKRVPTK
ncbi:MAG: terminase small subunit [Alphaproteobacteria bacterium]|nr:terminase small subunit [Alphaproteobacteria bacterium]MCW5739657.1 terminase small subunit [Alphaproteobacteria bacterium]